jgi:hypothetical protein
MVLNQAKRPVPALHEQQATENRFLCPQGALHQHNFTLYIMRILVSQLRRGDVLVLDNLRVHHLTRLCEWSTRRCIEVLFYCQTHTTSRRASRLEASYAKP